MVSCTGLAVFFYGMVHVHSVEIDIFHLFHMHYHTVAKQKTYTKLYQE